MAEKMKITLEGKQQLEAELHDLIHVVQPEVLEALAAARALGDLSENADYDAARQKQAEVNARIKEIQNNLANCEIIEKTLSKTISVGSTVTILDLSTNEESTYSIVGTVESNPFEGKISDSCPLAKSLFGHIAGEVVTVKVAKPYQVKVISFK